MANGDTDAEHLLQLELDLSLDLLHSLLNVVTVREGGRELSGLVEARSQQTRELGDESLRREESIKLTGQLLDELGVLFYR